MKNQQDSSKGKINFDLTYDGNCNNYFRRILNGTDAYEKTKLDLFTLKIQNIYFIVLMIY